MYEKCCILLSCCIFLLWKWKDPSGHHALYNYQLCLPHCLICRSRHWRQNGWVMKFKDTRLGGGVWWALWYGRWRIVFLWHRISCREVAAGKWDWDFKRRKGHALSQNLTKKNFSLLLSCQLGLLNFQPSKPIICSFWHFLFPSFVLWEMSTLDLLPPPLLVNEMTEKQPFYWGAIASRCSRL